MNTYYRTKYKWFRSPFNSATSLWNSQKSIKKYTKTVIICPQNCKFSSSTGGECSQTPRG